MRRAFAFCLLAVIGCGSSAPASSSRDDRILPTPDAGAAPAPVDLTGSDVDAFIEWAGASRQSQTGEVRARIEARKGDAAVLAALLRFIDAHFNEPVTDVVALDVVRELESADALGALDGYVWRAAPPGGDAQLGVEMIESEAVRAIACIPSDGARTDAQDVAARHPDAAVRDAAAHALKDPLCLFGE